MVLQNSGAISLDDIHVEAGGTSGTSASINDSDIRDMIDKSDGGTASFDEYYGASSTTYVGGTGGQTTTSGTTSTIISHRLEHSLSLVLVLVAHLTQLIILLLLVEVVADQDTLAFLMVLLVLEGVVLVDI